LLQDALARELESKLTCTVLGVITGDSSVSEAKMEPANTDTHAGTTGTTGSLGLIIGVVAGTIIIVLAALAFVVVRRRARGDTRGSVKLPAVPGVSGVMTSAASYEDPTPVMITPATAAIYQDVYDVPLPCIPEDTTTYLIPTAPLVGHDYANPEGGQNARCSLDYTVGSAMRPSATSLDLMYDMASAGGLPFDEAVYDQAHGAAYGYAAAARMSGEAAGGRSPVYQDVSALRDIDDEPIYGIAGGGYLDPNDLVAINEGAISEYSTADGGSNCALNPMYDTAYAEVPAVAPEEEAIYCQAEEVTEAAQKEEALYCQGDEVVAVAAEEYAMADMAPVRQPIIEEPIYCQAVSEM